MRPFINRKTLAVLCQGLFLFIAGSPLLGADYLVSHLSTSDGLSDNCVNSILCDRHGQIWFGTSDGLDYYDGHTIRNIEFQSSEDASTCVFALKEDSNGIIWIGTSRGLFFYDGNATVASRWSYGSGQAMFFPVKQMEIATGGKLWINGSSNGLLCIDPKIGEVKVYEVQAKTICGGNDGNIFALTSRNNLLAYDALSDRFKILSDDIDSQLVNFSANKLMYAFGHLLASQIVGDPLVIDVAKKTCLKCENVGPLKAMINIGPSSVCVGSRHDIHIMDSTFVNRKVILETNDNMVRCLCKDHSSGIWVGTQFNGVMRIECNDISLKSYPDSGEDSFKVREFAEDSDGHIWIGTDTRGLIRLSPDSGRLLQMDYGLKNKNVLGLMMEGHDLWVGTLDENEVVKKINTESGKVTKYPDAGKQAYAFCRDSRGRLWIGGLKGFIVGRDYPDGHFVKEMDIPSSQVCRILMSADESVWVATISGYVWHYNQGMFKTYKVVTTNFLTDLFIGSNGQVLISSEGDGIFVFDSENGCFEPCRTESRRFLRVSECSGLLWATTARQLCAIDASDYGTVVSVPCEKLDVGRFNYSSNFVSSSGMLYLGTSEGFITFSPKALLDRGVIPAKPILSGIKILSPEVKEVPLMGSDERKEICLMADAVSMELTASTMDYSICPTERLFWRIAEKSSEWTKTSNGVITINTLEAGKWTLQVKNESTDQKCSSISEIELNIASLPLLTPWEIFCIFIATLGLIILVVFITFRRTQIHLQKEQDKRDYEAKLGFLTSTAHEIRTPLSLILLPLDSLIQKFSTSRDKDVVENLDVMKRNSMKLSIFINELLDYQKLNNSNFSVHLETMDVKIPIRDAFRRFSSIFTKEGKTLKISLPDDPVYCDTDSKILGRILDNLISNALKYSSVYTSIKLEIKDGFALFLFENDGEIVPPNKRDKIFSAFFRYDEGKNAKTDGTGLGLSTSKSFAELLGGNVTMDNDYTVNRFILSLPVVVQKLPPVDSIFNVPFFEQSMLIVEDDKDMANVISGYFKDSFNLSFAKNGKEALQKIEQGLTPTIIVTDVIMPEMNGVELTRHLKENLSTSHIPVILLSADVSDKSMLEGLEQGADAYIEKPFSPAVLVTRVNNLIQNRKLLYNFFASNPLDVNIPNGSLSNSDQKFLRQIQEYVVSHIGGEISINDLASSVNMSSSTLFKKMKACTGTAPLEYINGVRLKKAADMLMDDSLSVSDVCFAVGFNTHSFFTSCFKRKYGMTPRQWRESSRKNHSGN